VPTLFVPNLDTATDDQLARARQAGDAGMGLVAASAADIGPALRDLLSEDVRGRIAANLAARTVQNGAVAAAASIVEGVRV